jgi:hypothetical protein
MTVVALEPQQLVSHVYLRGNALPADISEAVIGADISLDATQVSQLNLTFNDDDLSIMKKGYFNKGTTIDYLDQRLVIASISIQPSAAGKGQITLACRPALIQKLKLRKGALVSRNVSASQWIETECAAVGATCTVQPTKTRTSIARDVYVPTQNNTDASSWTTFVRLAREEGFQIWEVAGHIYFGQPSWFMQTMPVVRCIYSADPAANADYLMTSFPTANTSLDSVVDDRNISVTIPAARAVNFRPGYVMQVENCGMFDMQYFISTVAYPLLLGQGDATINGIVPINPTPQPRV